MVLLITHIILIKKYQNQIEIEFLTSIYNIVMILRKFKFLCKSSKNYIFLDHKLNFIRSNFSLF